MSQSLHQSGSEAEDWSVECERPVFGKQTDAGHKMAPQVHTLSVKRSPLSVDGRDTQLYGPLHAASKRDLVTFALGISNHDEVCVHKAAELASLPPPFTVYIKP